MFPSSDIGVMELAARTLVKIGQLPGSKGVESFEYDIKQAFEFISDERNEVRTRKAVHKDFDLHFILFLGETTCRSYHP